MDEMTMNTRDITLAIQMLEEKERGGRLLDKNELVQAYKMRGLLYMQSEFPSEAIDDYNKAFELIDDMRESGNPVDENAMAEVYALRGSQYFMVGQLNDAAPDFKICLKIWDSLKSKGLPVNEELYENARGITAMLVTFSDEDKDESIEYFNREIVANNGIDKSELANNYYYMAMNYMQSEDEHGFLTNLCKCIDTYLEIGMNQISNDDLGTLSSAYMCRAEIYYRKDEDNKSLDDYNKAVAIEKVIRRNGVEMTSFDVMDVIRLYIGRANVLDYLGKKGMAIDDYITALHLNIPVFEDFPDAQEEYYDYLDDLVDCMIEENIDPKRINNILQEFLYPLISTEKTDEADEKQNDIIQKVKSHVCVQQNIATQNTSNISRKVFTNEDAKKLERDSIIIPHGFTEIEDDVCRMWLGATIKNLVIPDSVVKIGNGAFSESSISVENLIIPRSVSYIGKQAFVYCSARNITVVGNALVIDEGAFQSCLELEKLIISGDVECINNGAFSKCPKLQEVIITGTVHKVDSAVFANCQSLTNVVFSEGLLSVGMMAFMWCPKLENVTLPHSVTNIGINAFMGCRDLTISCSVGSFTHKHCIQNNIKTNNDNSDDVYAELLLEKAETGASDAQYYTALGYLIGDFGFEKDVAKGVYWMEIAANQGHADAQCDYALCYVSGNGVDKDTQKAAQWLVMAAESGSEKAKKILSNLGN